MGEGSPHRTAAPYADAPQPEAGEGSVVRSAMVRFTVLSLVGLVLVALLAFPFAAWIARSMAQRAAEDRTRTFARSIAAPVLDAAVRQDPRSSALERSLLNRITDESVVHAVVWDEEGRVVWAEDRELIGTSEELDPEVHALFTTLGSTSEYSEELHAAGEHPDGEQVLEVYAAALDADGRPFVLEFYWPTSQLGQTEWHILTRFMPLTVGALLILHLLVLPLTLATARRVETDRRRLTRHALAVQNMERRRLSEDLHDGVVQDLSGIGYALPSVARDLPVDSQGRTLLERVAEAMKQDVMALRALIADIKPPDFAGSGLQEALDSLAARTRDRGLDVSVSVQGDVDTLSPGARALVYRIAREGLRNAVRHAQASRADVLVTIRSAEVRVTVRDDGVGPGGPRDPSDEHRDHFGLQLLGEAAAEVGGRLDLRSVEGGGAELDVAFRSDRM